MVKKHIPTMLGARVEPEVVELLDSVMAIHAGLKNGVIWTRSDLIRLAMIKGLHIVRSELESAPTTALG